MYQNLCRNDPEFDEEDLPAVTDVSDDETSPVTNKKKRFKSLFAKETRRASNIIAQMGSSSMIRDAEKISEARARASSTVIEDRTGKESEPTEAEEVFLEETDIEPINDDLENVTVEEVIMEHIEPAKRKTRKKNIPPKSTVFGMESVVLTPPPPCSPASPPRRGRRRPKITLDESSLPPVQKRGRGRQKKT